MKNLMMCIAFFLGLTAFGQEKKEYTLDGQTFWVVTESFDNCFGGKYKSDRLYHSQSGGFLDIRTECIACPMKIHNVSGTGPRLVVEYEETFDFNEPSRSATFYLIEEKWVQL